MTTYAVTGAGGFIGRKLVEEIAHQGHRVRALIRRPVNAFPHAGRIQFIQGDLGDAAVLPRLIEPGCVVLHLAHDFSADGDAQVGLARGLVEYCVFAGVARLVYCSTVSVYGRAGETILTEDSVCKPITEYGRTKLAIEEALIRGTAGKISIVILRPSAVFGQGGEVLVKTVRELCAGDMLRNYLRASLFGERRTHLVPVETVVAALLFLANPEMDLHCETFIISDDADQANNFKRVERIVREELALADYPFAPVPVPKFVLETLLFLRRRANVNSRTEYRSDKILRWGFVRPVSLEHALREFVREYHGTIDGRART